MRMRKRANLEARMERCAVYLNAEPEFLRGQWLANYSGYEKLYLELGCGKGTFTAETAAVLKKTFI